MSLLIIYLADELLMQRHLRFDKVSLMYSHVNCR